MPFEFHFWHRDPEPAASSAPVVAVAGRSVPVQLVRNTRARRYILRVTPGRAARVTIPRGGSAEEALRFVGRQTAWLEKQLQKQTGRPAGPEPWLPGTSIQFRGERVQLELVASGTRTLARWGSTEIEVPAGAGNLRPYVLRELWRLAIPELTARTIELAAQKGFAVKRVSVRNQRTRWGSCSRRGTISLNWRLIQVPESVRDYIILHELAQGR